MKTDVRHFARTPREANTMTTCDEVRHVSKAEKARLHKQRVAALERRQRRPQQTLPKQSKQPERHFVNEAYYYWKDAAHIDDFDHDDFEVVEARQVLDLLRMIERDRTTLHDHTGTLQQWLRGSPELATVWQRFTTAGGSSADDFARYMAGQLRPRHVQSKRHLRLVVSNPA
jgi:hypothetical protein